MMMAALGWFIAGICMAAFVVLWFSASFKELNAKRESLAMIREEVRRHRKLYMQERGGEYDVAAGNILESKRMAYREISKEYDVLLKKGRNRIPGYIMGFHPVGKDSEL